MTERPGDVLDEAAKLFDALRRRIGGDGPSGDVWGRATAEDDPRSAAGAAECRNCPLCRAMAVGRESGADVSRHLREAGRSLLAAALEVVAAFERTRGEASAPPQTGRSERSDPASGGRAPERGNAWSAATGGDPIE